MKKKMFFLCLFWLFIGFLCAIEFYLFRKLRGDEELQFHTAILFQIPTYIPWIFYTLLIFKICEKKRTLLQSIIIHIPVGILTICSHIALFATYTYYFMYTDPQHTLLKEFQFDMAATFHFQVFFYGAVTGTAYSYYYYKNIREKESQMLKMERQLSEAKLTALRMQLNPHFLFNALNSVSMLVRKNENIPAVNMIAGLSELLRHVLSSNEHNWVSLKREMEFLKNYLTIEGIRFQDKMRFDLKIASNTEHLAIPNLLLQPVVENAIKHGLSEKTADGLIQISSEIINEELVIKIIDNGPGISRIHSGPGVGIKNINQRLNTTYGESARFSLQFNEGEGTIGKFHLPLIPYSVETLEYA
jgi:two-component system, LytTR family, sensor kinase